MLDLTIVADRQCPTSRTYLTYLADAGMRVRQVLVVDFVYDLPGVRARRRWLGARMSSRLLQRRRPPAADRGPHFQALCDRVQEPFALRVDYASPEFDFGAVADSVSSFVATDYDDSAFHRYLLDRGRTFLYTNGGRVPASLLGVAGLRMLHIHPGVVPHVRGSDGLLWSLLVRGVPGASCFYMDPGLDTGALIATREFARPDFSDLREEVRGDPDLFYRVLLHAYDPHLRAITFVEALRTGPDPGSLPAREQDTAQGRQYFAMHRALRGRLFEDLTRD